MAQQTGSVMGVKETLRVLRRVDEDIYWSAIGSIKKAAKPMANAIDGAFPQSSPTRGFNHGGRTGWNQGKKTVTQFGGRRSRKNVKDQVWPLVRIKVTDAPREIFDMAGSKTSGNKLDTALRAKGWGSASRSVWRVAPSLTADANRAIKKACAEAARKANVKLQVLR
jgi:hypothetical protein